GLFSGLVMLSAEFFFKLRHASLGLGLGILELFNLLELLLVGASPFPSLLFEPLYLGPACLKGPLQRALFVLKPLGTDLVGGTQLLELFIPGLKLGAEGLQLLGAL